MPRNPYLEVTLRHYLGEERWSLRRLADELEWSPEDASEAATVAAALGLIADRLPGANVVAFKPKGAGQ